MKKSCDKVPKHQTIKKYNQVRNAVKNEKKKIGKITLNKKCADAECRDHH
jgi:hypothetical protein